MTQLHNAVLLDLMVHGPQALNDLDALARFAVAAGSPDTRRMIWQLANAITAGATSAKIPPEYATDIKRLHTLRVDLLAALVREGYAAVEEVGVNPGATIVMITTAGQAATAKAFAPLTPLMG